MDRLHSFSRVIVDSTRELCSTLQSSYLEKVKDTCKSGERTARGRQPSPSDLPRVQRKHETRY